MGSAGDDSGAAAVPTRGVLAETGQICPVYRSGHAIDVLQFYQSGRLIVGVFKLIGSVFERECIVSNLKSNNSRLPQFGSMPIACVFESSPVVHRNSLYGLSRGCDAVAM